jgi:hypothetical protein
MIVIGLTEDSAPSWNIWFGAALVVVSLISAALA